MKQLFDVNENPVAHFYEICNEALPIFPPRYIQNFERFENKINKKLPYLHIIGGSPGVYTINALAIISLKKAFEIAVQNNILDSAYDPPSSHKQD